MVAPFLCEHGLRGFTKGMQLAWLAKSLSLLFWAVNFVSFLVTTCKDHPLVHLGEVLFLKVESKQSLS